MPERNPIIERAFREGFHSGGMIGDISGGTGAKVSSSGGGRGVDARRANINANEREKLTELSKKHSGVDLTGLNQREQLEKLKAEERATGGTVIVVDPASKRTKKVDATPENLVSIESGRQLTTYHRRITDTLKKQGEKTDITPQGIVIDKGERKTTITNPKIMAGSSIVTTPKSAKINPTFIKSPRERLLGVKKNDKQPNSISDTASNTIFHSKYNKPYSEENKKSRPFKGLSPVQEAPNRVKQFSSYWYGVGKEASYEAGKVLLQFGKESAIGTGKIFYGENYGGAKPTIKFGQENVFKTRGKLYKDKDVQSAAIFGGFMLGGASKIASPFIKYTFRIVSGMKLYEGIAGADKQKITEGIIYATPDIVRMGSTTIKYTVPRVTVEKVSITKSNPLENILIEQGVDYLGGNKPAVKAKTLGIETPKFMEFFGVKKSTPIVSRITTETAIRGGGLMRIQRTPTGMFKRTGKVTVTNKFSVTNFFTAPLRGKKASLGGRKAVSNVPQTETIFGAKGITARVKPSELSRGTAQPEGAIGYNVFNRLLKLTPKEEARSLNIFPKIGAAVQYEKGLPVKDFIINIPGVKNPRKVTALMENMMEKEGGTYFGSLVTKNLPKEGGISLGESKPFTKGFQNIKQGDVDVMFSTKKVNEIEPIIFKFGKDLQAIGEDIGVSEGNILEFKTGKYKGNKFFEAKSGIDQETLNLGDEAPAGIAGFKFANIKAGEKPYTVKFGKAQAITAGEQTLRKGAGTLIVSPGKQPGETPAFSESGILGMQGNPRGLKDTAGFIQQTKGIAEIKKGRANPFQKRTGKRLDELGTEFYETYTEPQKVDIKNKLIDIIGTEEAPLKVPLVSSQTSFKSSGSNPFSSLAANEFLHQTSKENAKNIFKEGLKPEKGEMTAGTFLTKNKGALESASNKGVILKVTLDKTQLKEAKLMKDYKYETVVFQKIKPKQIVSITNKRTTIPSNSFSIRPSFSQKSSAISVSYPSVSLSSFGGISVSPSPRPSSSSFKSVSPSPSPGSPSFSPSPSPSSPSPSPSPSISPSPSLSPSPSTFKSPSPSPRPSKSPSLSPSLSPSPSPSPGSPGSYGSSIGGSIIKSQYREKLRSNQAYNVLVKRFGDFKTIAKGLPKGKALRAGASEARRTLGATFKIQQKGFTTTQDTAFRPNPSEFRSYKIVQGKRVETPNIFIQKRGKRLSAGSERREIQKERKKKLKGFFRGRL